MKSSPGGACRQTHSTRRSRTSVSPVSHAWPRTDQPVQRGTYGHAHSEADPTELGGYRAMPTASDRRAARLTFQRMRVLIADYGQLSIALSAAVDARITSGSDSDAASLGMLRAGPRRDRAGQAGLGTERANRFCGRSTGGRTGSRGCAQRIHRDLFAVV
jgi:hypothetical protein